MTRVLWRSQRPISSEQCELAEIPGGRRLSGLVLTVHDSRPVHVVYQVDLDDAWRTRVVRASLFEGDEPRMLSLEADGDGNWQRDGMPVPELDGCLDVDLEWTPATNTLPIRRLNLEAGTSGDVAAAWVRFPALTIERLDQLYQRIDDDHWLYQAGSFSARLRVDGEGLVLDYGGFWEAVAHSDPSVLTAGRRE